MGTVWPPAGQRTWRPCSCTGMLGLVRLSSSCKGVLLWNCCYKQSPVFWKNPTTPQPMCFPLLNIPDPEGYFRAGLVVETVFTLVLLLRMTAKSFHLRQLLLFAVTNTWSSPAVAMLSTVIKHCWREAVIVHYYCDILPHSSVAVHSPEQEFG